MRTVLIAVTLSAVALLSGCAVKKDFYAMGGSRADGTVDMAYDFRQFEQPVVNTQQAQSIAKKKCQVWGYGDAEPFGGQTTKCNQADGWGNCVAGQIVIQYQCLGDLGTGATTSSFAPARAQQPTAAAGDIPKEQWKQQQLQLLMQDTSLGYEEYMKRRAAILAQ